jgi:hypothetical protein
MVFIVYLQIVQIKTFRPAQVPLQLTVGFSDLLLRLFVSLPSLGNQKNNFTRARTSLDGPDSNWHYKSIREDNGTDSLCFGKQILHNG